MRPRPASRVLLARRALLRPPTHPNISWPTCRLSCALWHLHLHHRSQSHSIAVACRLQRIRVRSVGTRFPQWQALGIHLICVRAIDWRASATRTSGCTLVRLCFIARAFSFSARVYYSYIHIRILVHEQKRASAFVKSACAHTSSRVSRKGENETTTRLRRMYSVCVRKQLALCSRLSAFGFRYDLRHRWRGHSNVSCERLVDGDERLLRVRRLV